MVQYDPKWSNMVQYGPIWSKMVHHGSIWSWSNTSKSHLNLNLFFLKKTSIKLHNFSTKIGIWKKWNVGMYGTYWEAKKHPMVSYALPGHNFTHSPRHFRNQSRFPSNPFDLKSNCEFRWLILMTSWENRKMFFRKMFQLSVELKICDIFFNYPSNHEIPSKLSAFSQS